MRKFSFAFILLLLTCGFWIGVSTVTGETNQFIIDGADDSSTLTLSGSITLNDLIAGVAPHFVIQHANEDLFLAIQPVPSELINAIDTLLPRYVIQHANESRFIGLSFPIELVGDTDPPILADPPTASVGQDLVSITWTTDEFTTSLFEYGDTSGSYTDSIVDDLYKKTHQVTISGITPGMTIFYRITSTDLSMNISVSQEYSISVTENFSLYLPMVKN